MEHEILFSDTEKLFQSSVLGEQVICESLKICLEVGALNQKDGLQLSPVCLHDLEWLLADMPSNERSVSAWDWLEESEWECVLIGPEIIELGLVGFWQQ